MQSTVLTSNDFLQEIRENWWMLGAMAHNNKQSYGYSDFDIDMFATLHCASFMYKKMYHLTATSQTLRDAWNKMRDYGCEHRTMSQWSQVIYDTLVRQIGDCLESRYANFEQLPDFIKAEWNDVLDGEYPPLAVEVKGKFYCLNCFDWHFCDNSGELQWISYEIGTLSYLQHPLATNFLYRGLNEYDDVPSSAKVRENGLRCANCNAEIVESYQDDDDDDDGGCDGPCDEIDDPEREPVEAPDYSHYLY